jgi:hypothetical protein
MISAAADLARRLARDAEAVCRHYLSKGRRSGRYWIIGDVQNTPGRSLYVRLSGPDYGHGAAGKWTDAATGEHGDLLDLIALNRDLSGLGEAMAEARRFLVLPHPAAASSRSPPAPAASPEAARRLFRAGRPVPGTPAEAYLRARGITARLDWPSLRYLPSVYYREVEDAPLEQWPALLAAVTAHDGTITSAILAAAKASRRCSPSNPCCRACPWPRVFRPITSLHWRCRRRCAVSMSPATMTRPAAMPQNTCANALPVSRSASSSRCTPISTSISAASAPTACVGDWRIS